MKQNNGYSKIKRLMDITVSITLLLVALPFCILQMLKGWIKFRKNPFFVQERTISLMHEKFKLLKFRTLDDNSFISDDENILTKNCDTKIPKWYRFLRLSGLDELPQLLNVIKGNMSLVGPRPFSLQDLQLLDHYAPVESKLRGEISVKPGITGYWQLFGKREEGIKSVIECDSYYQKNISLKLDLYLLMKTLPVIIKGRHCDALISNFSYTEVKGGGKRINIQPTFTITQ